MRSIKVTFDNGDWLETNINGTNAEILKYYVGNEFNLGDGAGGDLMAKATSVEFLDEPFAGDISERPSLDAVLESKTANIPSTVYCSSCGGEFRHHLPTGFSHCEDHKGMHNYDE